MSQKTPLKSGIRPPQIKTNVHRKPFTKPVFHLQDKKADDDVLTMGMINSAKRTGQLVLCNKGLGAVPANVWKLDELVLDSVKDVDFNSSGSDGWWNSVTLKILDLSSNAISLIPPEVKLLQELVTLKLHDNALTALPSELGALLQLASLSLDHNKLTLLPQGFHSLTELRWLSLSHNQLEMINPDFGDLVMLTFLDLSHNRLSSLPPGLGYLVRLLEVNLSHNALAELPPDIVNLRDLKKFYVSHNQLKSLPALGELRKMEILEANHNDIVELPDFTGCAALKEVYLANNYITEITEDFCEQMQYQLNVLNVRDNKIAVLPENIALLKQLKRFDFANNNLNKLPSNMGLLCQLQSISMDGNRLSGVRSDVTRAGAGRVMRYLRDRMTQEVADEARTTEDDWPDKFTLKKSQALVLPARGLTGVPRALLAAAADAGVLVVDLSRNRLEEVPEGVSELSELSQLVLARNALARVPPALALCRRLQCLDLGTNALRDLPPALGGLALLRELVIANNRFTAIPQCVFALNNLEILLAAGNKIEQVDVSGLGRLPRLAVLDLRNNSISAVPPQLGTLTQLRSLELTGNLFRAPRHAILEKGTESVLSYLRSRIPT